MAPISHLQRPLRTSPVLLVMVGLPIHWMGNFASVLVSGPPDARGHASRHGDAPFGTELSAATSL